MTTNALRILIVLVAALAVAVLPTSADASTDTIVVAIPFEFAAGGEWLPAGKYTIRRTSQTASAFLIVRADGEASAAVTSAGALQGGREVSPPRLVFHEHEGMHYLAEVWMQGNNGKEVARRGFERNLAASDAEPGRVVVLVARAR